MFKDIIDRNEDNLTSVFYSRVSFVAGLLSLGTVAFMFATFWSFDPTRHYIYVESAIVLIFCFGVIGCLASFISFRIKEPSSFYKWFGFSINLLVIIGLFFLRLYS